MSRRVEKGKQTSDRKTEEETRPLLGVKEAGKLVMSLFGQPQEGDALSRTTQELLRRDILFPEMPGSRFSKLQAQKEHENGDFYWRWARSFFGIGRITTRESRPDSPAIFQNNVNRAEKIITLTIAHHFLGWGPQTDLVFAFDNQGEVRAFCYPKRSKPRGGLFQEIDSLEKEVRDLVSYQPGSSYDTGIRVSLWEAEREGCYSLTAGFESRGTSLQDLLNHIQELKQP